LLSFIEKYNLRNCSVQQNQPIQPQSNFTVNQNITSNFTITDVEIKYSKSSLTLSTMIQRKIQGSTDC